ncbi:NAD(P)H-binding protein [Yersinia pseudotuberculosis]|uniref:NAD(P)H-binding protein n=1 Tax=Yersinia pseudotuberculosis TaxID=633 RepID=UPI0005E0C21F|nr:NAD(P)H-binding protein [Yersinia pseudotuberculosis]CNC51966.1 oxidoreductase [Yersinia pseudotuberculosis]
MAKVLLLGASGLVGGELLRLLRLDARVTSIIAPTRNPLPAMNKLINLHGENIGQLLKTLHEPVDLVFCALGTTRKQAGSQAAFRQVDYRLVLLSGETGRRLGARHFLLVSALGANPDSWLFYNRTKGEAERDLQAQGWPQLTFARPSMLAGQRATPRLLENLSAPLFALLPAKWRLINAKDVAQAMLDQAFAPPQEGVTVLSSAQMQPTLRP